MRHYNGKMILYLLKFLRDFFPFFQSWMPMQQSGHCHHVLQTRYSKCMEGRKKCGVITKAPKNPQSSNRGTVATRLIRQSQFFSWCTWLVVALHSKEWWAWIETLSSSDVQRIAQRFDYLSGFQDGDTRKWTSWGVNVIFGNQHYRKSGFRGKKATYEWREVAYIWRVNHK